MFPRSPVGFRALATGIGFVLVFVACNGTKPSAAPSGPGGSGSAACPTAPTVPDTLDGWGPPAAAPDVIPTIIAAVGQLACGPTRLLFTITDKELRPIGSPDRPVKVDLFNLGRDPKTPIDSFDGSFVWAIEDSVGIYYANTSFPEAGRYGAAFTTPMVGGSPETLRVTFDVQPTSSPIKVGAKAPASKTPTADSLSDVGRISTDPHPDPRLYATSLDTALGEHKPIALIFATPEFCTSQQCGPTLDRIKPFLDRYPTVTFINAEPYKLKFADGKLQADLGPKGLQTTEASDDWGLLVEPTVYVIDRQGIVTANFDLIFSDQELSAALDAVK